ncbi:hypothetical protein VNI00_000521 [Paramarasmius palmivorus]|uniref:Uncharacterized protein n=1 Tax=Paramarasmius palmivorus TaxID=297713 RepID=A0AAW0E878_9AGAR
MEHFKAFLACLPGLTELVLEEGLGFEKEHIDDKTVGNATKEVGSVKYDLSRVERLEIVAECTLFDWFLDFLRASRPASLHIIKIRSLGFSTSGLRQLLDEFGTTLKHLTIDPINNQISQTPDVELRPLPSSLTLLPSLETLFIGMIHLDYKEQSAFQPRTVLKWVGEFAETLRADSLCTLGLYLYAESTKDVRSIVGKFDWKSLTSGFAKRFPNIRRFVLDFHVEFDEKRQTKVEEEIRRRIPSTAFGGKTVQVIVHWDPVLIIGEEVSYFESIWN